VNPCLRRSCARAVTAAVTAVCILGFAGAASPVIKHAITLILFALAALAATVAAARREGPGGTVGSAGWKLWALAEDQGLASAASSSRSSRPGLVAGVAQPVLDGAKQPA
jgi:hypothetical protein